MLSQLTALAVFALQFTWASPLHAEHPPVRKRLPTNTWFHDEDHFAHALFKRQSANSSNPTDGVTYPTVGSPQWAKAYPADLPDTSKLPVAWTNALNAAVSAGKIPNIPPSTLVNGNPTYPKGYSATSARVCSGTYQCRIPGDIWDAPEGTIGCGFDDGPLPTSDRLYQFLQANNQRATHFFIGTNIIEYPKEFLSAYNAGDDIAVHTWTHPFMTTLTNLEVVAQFGWTMELIHNSTGGRLPKYWRPPYGDTDVRVMAIAKEVFGLTTILWNQDTEDWSLTSGGTTLGKINSSMTKWLTGSKSPGLIILEHELSDQSVAAFIAAYPVMKENGWNITSAAELYNGTSGWANSAGYNSSVAAATDIIAGSFETTSGVTASASAAGSSSTASGNSKNSAVGLHGGALWGFAVASVLAVISTVFVVL